MSNETEFADGLIVKAPNENAPEYVKAKASIKNAEFIAFLQARLDRGEEWTNLDIKVGQSGKWYAAVDNWKPNQGDGQRREPRRESPPQKQAAPAGDFASDFADDDIPF